MPQEMQVLRCYSCEAFQVHIVKKVPKWECKVCGEKQSVKKVYAKGCGKDCRLHVQQLNQIRLQKEEELNLSRSLVTPSPSCSSYTANSDTLLENSTSSQWGEFFTTDSGSTDTEKQVSEYTEDFEDIKYHDWKLNNIEPLASVQTSTESKNILVTDDKKEFNENIKTSRWSEFITTDDSLHVEVGNDELSHSNYERPNKMKKYTQMTQQHIKDEEELYLNVALVNHSNNIFPRNTSTSKKEKSRLKYTKFGKSHEIHVPQNVKETPRGSKGDAEFNTAEEHEICDNIAYVKSSRWAEYLSPADNASNEDEAEKPNYVYEKCSKERQITNGYPRENVELKCTNLLEYKQDNARTNADIRFDYEKIIQNDNDGHATSKKGLYESCTEENELEAIFTF